MSPPSFDKKSAGTAAAHPPVATHPFRVAPTTSAERNVIRAGILPIGCWRIDDLRFEFDSSIVRPEAAKEFAKLHALRADHPGAPLSIYGHADPVGNDVYNKKLSGRRAHAVYALLVRDPAIWESLYKNPIDGSGDKWSFKATQVMLAALGFDPGPATGELNAATKAAVKDFQSKNDLEDDGDPGPLTRQKLFPLYMDAVCVDAAGEPFKLEPSDFLAQGAHADGKGDIQGCGEFNPVLMFSKEENDAFSKPAKKAERDGENAPNRRVMALLYRPGSQVDPARWPCPSVKEGPEGCKKRFFADADKRRTFQETRREFKDTKDTFACRFYQRQTEHSPCETGAGPVPMILPVVLRVCWKDPDGTIRPFPEETPVEIVYAGGAKESQQTGKDGVIAFAALRAGKAFHVELPGVAGKYLGVPPEGEEGDADLVEEGDVKDLAAKGWRLYLLPKDLTQRTADWSVGGTPKRSVDGLEDEDLKEIGNTGKPADLCLDPHWQYVRLEYFDRYFGRTDHGNKRVCVPGVFLDGWKKDPGGRGAHAGPDARSNWVAAAKDLAGASGALPWILQRTPDEKDDPAPKAGFLLQCVTDASTFVFSEDKEVRKLEVVSDKAKLAPSAERLRYYDLPPLWKSRGWSVRPAGGAAVEFAKLTDDQVKASLDRAKRLVFCLDDLVLTDDKRHAVTLAASDSIAVFYHRFVASADAGGATSPMGVYRPDTAGLGGHFSQPAVHRGAYVFDPSNWARLVVAQGNLFEAFADRTPDEDPNDVVGARAAVRWVDGPPTGKAAGQVISVRPGRTAKDFFSITPFFEQLYNQTNRKYSGPGTITQSIGRFDLALLRCCDRDGDQEVVTVFHYFRMNFIFQPNAPAATPASIYHPPNASANANRTKYMNDACANMAHRLNGNDAVNTIRGEIVGKEAADKIKGQVVYFVQPVTTAALAHFNLDVVRPGAGQLGGRAWMFGVNGTGELGENSQAPESSFSPGSYVAAHELGHGGSLPDEYNERWNAFSFNELSFQNNVPGDPFETDGANWDPAQVTNVDSGLMNGVQQMRNRYLWHSAEYARIVTGKKKFLAKYGTYDKFELPSHNNAPFRSYVYWPIADQVDGSNGARGKFDLLLYAMGEDRFAKDLMPNGPHQGTLVVHVKLRFNFDATLGVPATISQVLPALRNRVQADHGRKFYAKGKINAGSPAEDWEFKKCLLRFSPRFIVSNGNTANATYQGLITNVGPHFDVNVNAVAAATNSRWNAATTYILEINAANPNWQAQAQADFSTAFAEMLGFANAASVTAAALKPLVQRVIPTDADVQPL